MVVEDCTIPVVRLAPLTLRFTLTHSGSVVPFTRHPCFLPPPVAAFDLHLFLVDLQPACLNRSSIAAANMNGVHVSFHPSLAYGSVQWYRKLDGSMPRSLFNETATHVECVEKKVRVL